MAPPKLFAHQEETLKRTIDAAAHAAFWEQGTGKTRFILETAETLRLADRIDAVFIFAPNGVHRQWIEDELPTWRGQNEQSMAPAANPIM